MHGEISEPLSSEAFAARLRQVISELENFSSTLTTVADVRTSEADGYWRLTLSPFALNTCPLDLFLRADQMVDVAIGPEAIEDLPAGDLSLFPMIVTAVSEGRIVIRHHVASATNALLAVETRVILDDGQIWQSERWTKVGKELHGVSRIDIDRRYLPYA